jgi:uncharacterized protein (UPF0248 family)
VSDHPLRKILSGIVRGSAPKYYEIAYLHRGAPEDRVTIRASEITQVRKGSFVLSDGETQIPFHRILYVRDDKNGLVIWEKRTRSRNENHNP